MAKFVRASGGVVYRKCCEAIEVVLVGAGRPPIWRLPKGIANEGEQLDEAAIREVGEESGVVAEVVEGGIVVNYDYDYEGELIHKEVTYFLMKATAESEELRDGEYDKVTWVPPDEAISLLFYDNEKNAVRHAVGRLGAGPIFSALSATETQHKELESD